MLPKIGTFQPQNPFFLAPMEAVNCASYRLLCKRRGAALVYTDMIDADIFMEEVEKTGEKAAVQKFVNPQKDEYPLSIQLGGGNAKTLVASAVILQKYATLIDYNVGCPLSYMLGKKGGVYLSKHPDQLKKIIIEMRAAIKIPFTVKIRAGWDDDSKNAPVVAAMLEELGVDAIAIHPRTRKELYSKRSDWPLARKVREAVKKVPVILSGDVTNLYMAYMAFVHTKCDYIMCARGAKNNPSIFKRLVEKWKSDMAQPEKPYYTYEKLEGEPQKDFEDWIKLYHEREHRNLFTEIRDHALWTARECIGNDLVKRRLMSARDEREIKDIIKGIRFGKTY